MRSKSVIYMYSVYPKVRRQASPTVYTIFLIWKSLSHIPRQTTPEKIINYIPRNARDKFRWGIVKSLKLHDYTISHLLYMYFVANTINKMKILQSMTHCPRPFLLQYLHFLQMPLSFLMSFDFMLKPFILLF